MDNFSTQREEQISEVRSRRKTLQLLTFCGKYKPMVYIEQVSSNWIYCIFVVLRSGVLYLFTSDLLVAHQNFAKIQLGHSPIYLNLVSAFPNSGEPSPTRREAVKKKTAEYLMRAEQISSQNLRSNMGQGSTQTVVSASKMSMVHMLDDGMLCAITRDG